jgi:hypothetical protein
MRCPIALHPHWLSASGRFNSPWRGRADLAVPVLVCGKIRILSPFSSPAHPACSITVPDQWHNGQSSSGHNSFAGLNIRRSRPRKRAKRRSRVIGYRGRNARGVPCGPAKRRRAIPALRGRHPRRSAVRCSPSSPRSLVKRLTRPAGPSPAGLTIELRRSATQLGIHGIIVKVSRRHRGRVVSLARVRTVSDCNADTP